MPPCCEPDNELCTASDISAARLNASAEAWEAELDPGLPDKKSSAALAEPGGVGKRVCGCQTGKCPGLDVHLGLCCQSL